MVKDHADSEREETRCRHMGYSFRLAASVLLYAEEIRKKKQNKNKKETQTKQTKTKTQIT